ncbi:MAG: hypothetical protein AAGP08_03855 [Pseudomonadota bacterium]
MALDLAQCERVTHVYHGGEDRHRDLGEGRVSYMEWWSLEGVYTDLIIADCNNGQKLMTRTKEERISDRPPFDRTEKALTLLDQQMSVSPALFSLDRIADALKGTGRDIEIAALDDEPCACAALYPEMRGPRAPFREALQ